MIEHKYALGTLVYLSDLDTEGVVEAVSKHVNHILPIYQVRYIDVSGYRKVENFVEYELEPVEE